MPAATVEHKPVYAIVGDCRLLAREALERILASLAADQDGMGPARFDGSEIDEVAEVLDEVRTPSLLDNRRIAIVDNASALISPKRKETTGNAPSNSPARARKATHLESPNRKLIERYCEAPSDTGVLILLCKSLPKTQRIYKAIARTGSIVHCDPPKSQAIAGWIVDRARTEHGKRISQSAARTLREHTGDDVGTLDAELSKLATYVGERAEITPDDIIALTGRHREEKIFAVTDAIAAKDPVTAMMHWEQVLATDRAAPGRAIAGLAWGVRQLLSAKRDQEEGVSLGAIARRMFTNEHVARRRLECVAVEELEQQHRDLLAADLAIKTGNSTIDLAVAKFIVTHGTAAGAMN